MILQRLAEHYDRINGSSDLAGEIATPGFSLQKISFCVVLEPNGRLNSLHSLQEQVGKQVVARQMAVPGQGKPSGSGINPCFLWDGAPYMLGYKADDVDPERTAQSFEAFRKRHLDAEQTIDDPAFSAVCAFLRSWSPERAQQHSKLLSEIATNFGVFRIAGEQRYVHEAISPEFHHADPDPDGDMQGTCLVTGLHGTVARLHEPKIKGIAGSQTSGALLVSFNAPSYESYGKSQSYNAPVSEDAVFKYANALNYLLNRKDRRISLGDATVVFWADHRTRLEEFVSDLLSDQPITKDSDAPEDQERVRQARHFVTQLRDGVAESDAIDEESQTKFYLLGLSPNASRISVRLWIEADVSELKRRLGQHLRDIELFYPREDLPLTVRRIVAATGRAETDPKGRLKGFDTGAVSPQLAGDLARSVLTGGAYPQSLLSTMLRRIRSDGEVHYSRVAAIKACLVRNSRLRGNPLEVSVKLDPNQSEAAYNTGRLFALLEKIQTDSAGGELNSTIKDRYFSSASATPSLVFPRLFRLSQHHLAKLERGSRIFYERRLGEVMTKLDGFPGHLALEDQGKFVIGYFHQRQDLYTSRKKESEDVSE
jgi:CRISPR-associated protein Csd1